jgi:hypothetical protein
MAMARVDFGRASGLRESVMSSLYLLGTVKATLSSFRLEFRLSGYRYQAGVAGLEG